MKKEIIHDKIIVYQKDGDLVHQIHDVTAIIKNMDGITVHGRKAGNKKGSKLIFMGAKIIFYENELVED
jgi:phosphohistidine swiveling domain-containing protein